MLKYFRREVFQQNAARRRLLNSKLRSWFCLRLSPLQCKPDVTRIDTVRSIAARALAFYSQVSEPTQLHSSKRRRGSSIERLTPRTFAAASAFRCPAAVLSRFRELRRHPEVREPVILRGSPKGLAPQDDGTILRGRTDLTEYSIISRFDRKTRPETGRDRRR